MARRSVRRYTSKPVEKEKLEHILEAGKLAPSAANRQPWHFILVTDPDVKEKLRASYDSDWFTDAPIMLVVCAEPSKAWVRKDGEEYWKVDVAIAMQNMILCATSEDLGTCWIAALDEQNVKSVLGIPSDIRVVAMTPIGYPSEDEQIKTDRKSFQEIVHYNHW